MAEIIATPEQAEKQMTTVVTGLEAAANNLVIDSDERYNQAAAFLQRIKTQQKTVTDFFEPLRKATKAAYDSVLSRKKDMTTPLDKAEKVIKGKMGEYQRKAEQARREQEEKLRRAAEAEREKAFSAAVAAEASGDALGAEMAMVEAEIMDDAAAGAIVHLATPKAKGISSRKGWEITGIDPDKVPVTLNGVVIRPVDEKAVMALIKASKGTIQIPGITYRETAIISAKRA
ncbi:MAG: hypothetical protein IJE58_03020 [Oscillospiraceae bacterium]|nr:hypothetical protein [Oscillospiraceae bacterium]